ncbi:MAG TPA: tetratricopeptide repeat protein [Pyrinomonadaceae bacterium]|nr:tetratricopeptide repeat protein [Pyrinomonadaceae bacterium]
MADELVQLDARRPLTRAFLVLLLIVATGWSYYAFRWYLGNTLAEYFNADENNLEMAQIAQTLAPNDPLTNWRLAQVLQKKLPLGQEGNAIAEYERAVALAPNDYRFWMALGTAREHAGDKANAETALRQAVSLAPSYAFPRWYLGNLLLREGRYDEAFAELRFASDGDPELRPQLFNLAWEIYGGDFEALKNSVGQNPDTRAEFALYLFTQRGSEDGLRLWNTLPEKEMRANKVVGNSLITALVGAKRYLEAMRTWNYLVPNDFYRAEIGHVIDGGFEEPIEYGASTVFGWQVKNAPQVQIGIDPGKAHSGDRSLRFVFQVRSKIDSLATSQLVTVAPNTQYDFECYVKTQKLQTGGPPAIQIFDAASGAGLAQSETAPNGDSDWSRVALSFKTGEKAEAVILKIVNTSCGEDLPVCPIFGTVWYDDFSLKRRD